MLVEPCRNVTCVNCIDQDVDFSATCWHEFRSESAMQCDLISNALHCYWQVWRTISALLQTPNESLVIKTIHVPREIWWQITWLVAGWSQWAVLSGRLRKPGCASAASSLRVHRVERWAIGPTPTNQNKTHTHPIIPSVTPPDSSDRLWQLVRGVVELMHAWGGLARRCQQASASWTHPHFAAAWVWQRRHVRI